MNENFLSLSGPCPDPLSLSGPCPDTPPPFEKGGRKLYSRACGENKNTRKALKNRLHGRKIRLSPAQTAVCAAKKFLKVPKTFFKKFLGGVWGNAPKTPRAPKTPPAAVKQDEKPSLRSFFGGWRRKKRTKKTPAQRAKPIRSPASHPVPCSLSGPRPDTPPPFEKGGRKLYLRGCGKTKSARPPF